MRWITLNAVLLGLVAALTVGSAMPAAAQSGWSVLEYDAQGRPIGMRRGDGDEARGTNGAAPNDTGAAGYEKPVEPGELLLADPEDGAAQVLETLGYSIQSRHDLENLGFSFWRVRAPEDMPLHEALRQLREALPETAVDSNDLLDLSRNPQLAQSSAGPPDFARKAVGWGDVPESCGRGIVLGQIDGAVDTGHLALIDQDLIYKDHIKPDRVPAAQDHGTAIAVMLIGKSRAGRSGGLLPGARLYAANIFEKREGRAVGNLAALLRAIDWLVGNGVQVANLSIAGDSNIIMKMAVRAAKKKKLMLVAAAGNRGPGARAVWPAATPESLAVTAIDRHLGIYIFANRGDYIDFAAPGVGIVTETPMGLREQSGTSMATPFVTAMVALHLDAGFPADPDRIRDSMKRYAHDLGSEGRDDDFGWGLVRIRPNCG